MAKIARKVSEDPKQEKLRQNKSDWNSHVSRFISTLIALKQAMNGRDVPELHLSKSSIKEPIPDIVPSLLDHLASEYAIITSDGKSLVNDQLEYSKTRNVSKVASNSFTRFFTYITLPFQFSDKNRFERKNLLKSAVKVENLLLEIEDYLLSRDPLGIPKAILSSKDFYHVFQHDLIEASNDFFIHFKNDLLESSKELSNQEDFDFDNQEESASNSEENSISEIEEDQNEKMTSDLSERDIAKNMSNDVNHWINYISNVEATLDSSQIDDESKKAVKKHIESLSSLFPKFFELIQKNDMQNASSLFIEISRDIDLIKDFLKQIKSIASIANENIKKFASNNLSRWMKRKIISLSKNKEATIILSILSILDKIKFYLNQIQDLLESNSASIKNLIFLLQKSNDLVSDFFIKLILLADIYNNKINMENLSNKEKSKKLPLISQSDIFKLKQIAISLKEVTSVKDIA